VGGKAWEIQADGAPVRVLVVRTNEELEIALQAEAVVEMNVKKGVAL
jgi:acetate kinase